MLSEYERIDATPCPSCGRSTLSSFEDVIGIGAQCTSHDCLETFEKEELFNDTKEARDG